MLTIKRLLGLALIATWIWLLYVLAMNIGFFGSIVTGGMTILIAGLLILGRRALLGITASIILIFLIPRLLGEPPSKILNDNLSKNAYYLNNIWKPFDEAAIQGFIAQGKTVFVDVTADWCLTCKVNKQLSLIHI